MGHSFESPLLDRESGMTRQIEVQDDAIAFAEKVFTLLDETRYTTTYKLAVLLALMDLCLEKAGPSGGPPDVITGPIRGLRCSLAAVSREARQWAKQVPMARSWKSVRYRCRI